MSSRFVAGMSVDDVISACERVNREGIAATLDSLGESVTTEAEAQKSADIYHQLLDAIEAHKLNANVSVKLSQVGMDFDPALAERIVGEMVAHAAQVNSFVRIDMEGSPYTEATIAMTERLSAKYPGAVGTVLQAYLYRTDTDTDRLLGQGIRIRLCKGAYKEGPDVAFPSKADVDANYVKLMKRMVTSQSTTAKASSAASPPTTKPSSTRCAASSTTTRSTSTPSSSRCSTASAATCNAA